LGDIGAEKNLISRLRRTIFAQTEAH